MRGRRTAGRAVSYLRLGVMPRLFVYTSSGTPPNGLAYKPASKSALLNEDEKRINRYIVKIHQWQGKLAKTSRELA